MLAREATLTHEIKSRVGDEVLVQRRRMQIADAAVELFARRGYYETTVLDVARKAGVSAGLIYQYVSDKDDVLLLALLSVLEEYKREIPRAIEELADPLERWRAALLAYCRVIDRYREGTILTYRSTKSLPADRRELIKRSELETNALVADVVRGCIEAGLFRPVDVEVVTYLMITSAHTWALKHWRLREVCTFDAYVGEALDLFARALLTPSGRRRYRKLVARDAASREATAGPAEPPPCPPEAARRPPRTRRRGERSRSSP